MWQQQAPSARGAGTATHFYYDTAFKHPAAKILPGEYYVSGDEMVLVTVLGSCVSACIWDKTTGIGGMNHFMLPETGETDLSGAAGRYGTYAMELLINEMLKSGARRERLQAKIFGGAQVMHNFTSMNVGERNTAFVQQYLQTERIAVLASDVLDIHPRKVCFFPVSGRAMVRRLAHAHPEALVAQERSGRADAVAQTTAGGSIDLF